VQVDVQSAKTVIEHSSPTLVPLTVTVETFLRRAYLDALRQTGWLGRLLARQAEAFAEDEQNEARFGATCAGLPDDTINFQHDPLACAIALGWREGVESEELLLRLEIQDGWLVERVHPEGKRVRVVTKVDGERFSQFWLELISALRQSAQPGVKSPVWCASLLAHTCRLAYCYAYWTVTCKQRIS